jgi:hypothetical protein
MLAVSWQRIHYGNYQSKILWVFLPFPAAANSEDSTQFSSDYCSVLLQLPASEFTYLITILHGPNEKQSVLLAPLPSNIRPTVACSCVAGMCLLRRCLAMIIFIKIFFSHLRLGLPSVLFPTNFSHRNPICIPLLPHACEMPCQSHSPCLIVLIMFGEEYKLWNSSLWSDWYVLKTLNFNRIYDMDIALL